MTVWGSEAAKRGSILSPLGVVRSLALSSSGDVLAMGAEEGFSTWTTCDLKQITFSRGTSTMGVAVHPAGQMVAAMDGDRRCELWSLQTNRHISTLGPVTGTASYEFSADGRHLLAVSGGGQTLQGWMVGGTPERAVLLGHRGGVPGVAFGQDGSTLATVSKDGTARVWSVETGATLHTCKASEPSLQCVAVDRGGTLLAAGGWAGVVHFWRLADGHFAGEIDCAGRTGGVWGLAFSPSGTSLAVAGNLGARGVGHPHGARPSCREPSECCDISWLG